MAEDGQDGPGSRVQDGQDGPGCRVQDGQNTREDPPYLTQTELLLQVQDKKALQELMTR